MIEHNLDVIKSADYIIDLGPEGGNAGGEIIAEGTPEEVSTVQGSHTARFLAPRLSGGVSYLEASEAEAIEAVFEEEGAFEADYEEFEDDEINDDSEDFEEDSEKNSKRSTEGQIKNLKSN